MASTSVQTFDKNAPFGHKLSPLLEYIGFELEIVSSTCVQGRFVVSERSAQAYGVLHGGVSAFLTESLGSLGAFMASGFQRAVGVELSISHLQPAPIGLEIEVIATPIYTGRRLHVWGVKFISKISTSNGQFHQRTSNTSEPGLIAISKLTVNVLPTKATMESQDVESIPSKL